MKARGVIVAVAVTFPLGGLLGTAAADTPTTEVDALAKQIDHYIQRRWTEDQVSPAARANDAEFLRRVYLDIAGKIPPVSRVRQFLDDSSENKRREVVDQLLESPAYITHFTNRWRQVLIPEASTDVRIRGLLPGFEEWLRSKLADNTSYAEMVREILTQSLQTRGGNGDPFGDVAQVSPLVFYQAKQIAPENLAAATSRMFLGVRIGCAQCHDHPFDDWQRDDFWSLAAFFAGLQQPNSERRVPAQIREQSDRHEITIPDTQRVVQAAFLDGSQPQWRFRQSSRATLADWVTSADNTFFTRTAANRIWQQFFGMGLVDPVDDFGPNNPPSHPELLDELAQQLAAHDFDLKYLIRAVTASQTYQRTSEISHHSPTDPRLFARMAVKGMSAEQLSDSLAQAIGHYRPFNPRSALQGGDYVRTEVLELFSNDIDTPTQTQTTILQALSMMNGQIVSRATDIQGSSTLTAVLEYPLMDLRNRIETLFLATLSRPPRQHELDRITAYVNDRSGTASRQAAMADVFWVLLNSSEFMFNH